MTTEAKQNTIIRYIVQTTDTEVLDQVLSLLGTQQPDDAQNDWWNQIADNERDLLLYGAAQAAEGKTTSHSDVSQRVQKILSKNRKAEQ